MSKWKYNIMSMGDEKSKISDILKHLNTWGESGLELVTFYEGHYVFKKKIE